MLASELYLTLFAFTSAEPPAERLEDRMKRFLESEPTSESLDAEAFAQLNGSDIKADYLLGNRRFVAELKTINGNPKDRVQRRLKDRFARPGSPIVFGQMGLSPILKSMPDQDEILKMMHDVSVRAVRRHLQKSNEQIEATKARLDLNSAAGLMIIMNDSEPMVEAASIGYAIKSAIDAVESGYPEISYVWASVECHRIKMPDGTEGFPQLFVSRSTERPAELQFLGSMLDAWAHFNGSVLRHLDHNGNWDCLSPIVDGGPTVLELF